MKTLSIIIIVTALFFGDDQLIAQEMPSWVKNRPVSKNYYVGIGVAQKNLDNSSLHETARNNALKDMSAEISSYITSRIDQTIIEKAGVLIDDYKNEIILRTSAHLTDYQQMDSWETEKEYWVYYRLSKERYLNKRNERLQNARDLSFDLYIQANISLNNNDIPQALLFYLQAYSALEEFIAFPIKVKYENKEINLGSKVYVSIQDLISKISIMPLALNYDLNISQVADQSIPFSVTYIDENNNKVPLKNIPMSFSYVQGSGQMIENTVSNEKGISFCRITRISPSDRNQIIQGILDVEKYKKEDLMQRSLLNNLSLPKADCHINISSTVIFVRTNESHLGSNKEINYIESTVKNFLSGQNVSFTTDISEADFQLDINAISRRGSNAYNLYIAYVDLTISLIDLNQQTEIYRTIQNNIKATDLSYQKAELTAYDNANKKIENVLPELINIIQN